jgi:hypothetical protein
MNEYEKKKLAMPGIASATSSGTDADKWLMIRRSSVRAFAERTARNMGAPITDRRLIGALTEMALTSGQAEFVWNGHKYTGRLVLMIYARPPADAPFEPFRTRQEWDEFAELMRLLRDPTVSIAGHADLLRIGEFFEARQKPHAVAKGWTA